MSVEEIDHPHLHEGVFVIVDPLLIHPHGHIHPGLQHIIDRRDSIPHNQITAGVVGDKGVFFRQQSNILFTQVDSVAQHQVGVHQSQII